MTRRIWALLATGLFLGVPAAGNAQRPPVVFILADDLAWSDLACYGHSWHETPHLDRLAAEGMRFTRAYAPAPICSASRASFLTGKSPARLGFEFVTKDKAGRQSQRPSQLLQTPPFTLDLPLEETTIAEAVRDHGVHTAFFGKWHLNAHHGRYLGWSPTHGPRQQGFLTAIEDFGGHPYGAADSPRRRPPITEPGRYPDDSLTERAIEFLRSKPAGPFFLTVSHFYVHTPVEPQCRWLIDKYAAKIPLDSPNVEKRARYAAYVETLDHLVGRLLTALDETGLRDDVLVVFTSDNGGHPAYTANGPLRGSKWNLYEGGVRVPLVCRFPGTIPPGSTCAVPVIGYDLFPTILDVMQVPQSTGTVDRDGRSLVGLFRNPRDPAAELDRTLFWHFPYYHPEQGFGDAPAHIGVDDFAVSQTRPHAAVLHGSYKLLSFFEDDRMELYDLDRDPAEKHNLVESAPYVADELRQELDKYLAGVGARMPASIDRSPTN